MRKIILALSMVFSFSCFSQIADVSSGQPIQASKINEVIGAVNGLSAQDALTKINELIIEVNKLKAQNTLVVMKTSGSPSATFAAATTSLFKYPGVSRDSHSGYSTATGFYTVAVEGWYRVHVQQQMNLNVQAGHAFGLQLIKNNSTHFAFPFIRATNSINSNMSLTASGSEYFLVGDTISARGYVEGNSSSVGSAGDFLIIERLPSAP